MIRINKKRFLIAFACLLLFFFVSDFLFHGFLMDSSYKANPSLWRSEVEMQSTMPFMFVAQLLLAFFFTFIFVKGYEGKGVMEGIRFGLVMAPIGISHYLVQYLTTPIPNEIMCSWCVALVVQWVAAGIIAASIYRAR